ncbi:hypothetical protein GE278_10260 [Enterobacteriaceae bacterium Kacie_13]|nr:hypothetical protein GE278_10260 [Enterobacteriaceae bacterium Kacie_13]
MPTTYTIHLKNLQSADKTFWCFLNFPESQISADVYANSSANLTVSQHQHGQDDSFSIPLQYVVQAGASNKAVALNTLIQSSIKKNTDLATAWHADYYPANKGPSLYVASDEPAPGNKEVDVWTNDFDKSQEPLQKWFSSLTFGVMSESGFMGVTWSPDPEQTYRIQPKVQFYVATGNFESNKLADITAISSKAANITGDSFDGNNECTVTLKTNGQWLVEPGNTNATSNGDSTLLSNLVKTNMELATAQSMLVAMYSGQLPSGTPSVLRTDKYATSTGIKIKKQLSLTEGDGEENILITGTITIATAIAVGFAYMIASGITLTITRRAATGLEFDFNYNGTRGAEAVQQAFAAGQSIDFRTA